MTDRPDLELLHRMRAGDSAAASVLWLRIAPKLLALATAMLRDRHVAEDIVQSVFVSAVEMSEPELERVRNLSVYLATSTRNRALNMLRTKSREVRRSAMLAAIGRGQCETAEPADDSLQRAVDGLPEPHREIILLRHFAGLTLDQVAQALGDNPNTTASRYRSALAALRALLAPTDTTKTELRHA